MPGRFSWTEAVLHGRTHSLPLETFFTRWVVRLALQDAGGHQWAGGQEAALGNPAQLSELISSAGLPSVPPSCLGDWTRRSLRSWAALRVSQRSSRRRWGRDGSCRWGLLAVFLALRNPATPWYLEGFTFSWSQFGKCLPGWYLIFETTS